MNLEEAINREEIHHLAARWTDAVLWQDYETFRALWTDDAVWTIDEPFPIQVTEADRIVAKMKELLTLEKAFFQALHEGVIEIDGDRASARWGMTEFGTPSEPNPGLFQPCDLSRSTGENR